MYNVNTARQLSKIDLQGSWADARVALSSLRVFWKSVGETCCGFFVSLPLLSTKRARNAAHPSFELVDPALPEL